MNTFSDWEQALICNCDIPHGDRLAITDFGAIHEVRSHGNWIDPQVGNDFRLFFEFILEQQGARRNTGKIPKLWKEFCASQVTNKVLLGPRWTLPYCYFDVQYKDCFSSAVGLDVGCNIPPMITRKFSDHYMKQKMKNQEYEWCYETYTSHHRYYQEIGCHMIGIDIHPHDTISWDVDCADLRMLAFDDNFIDFFTIAMIFGPGNPASTYLDSALCLSELRRTCAPNGLIYIAEFVIMPSLILAIIEAGFRVFANNSYRKGVPIGMFLISKETDFNKSRFSTILKYLIDYELKIIDTKEPQQIIHRELLRRNSPPPRIVTGLDSL